MITLHTVQSNHGKSPSLEVKALTIFHHKLLASLFPSKIRLCPNQF